ncbi:hypothetical protein GMOD_00005858 [Pyrenophora seminiperda CCB06]|uniref:Uncharacterized protein n=1 Tax=Pyrenophora seminiperda CCB06 TaxID=1302712 RepID=A0A3M7M9Y3_9PLEO|nr:hypothetical protein GMOD_00005858 [Pyrenophora seminiperda CCB06]
MVSPTSETMLSAILLGAGALAGALSYEITRYLTDDPFADRHAVQSSCCDVPTHTTADRQKAPKKESATKAICMAETLITIQGLLNDTVQAMKGKQPSAEEKIMELKLKLIQDILDMDAQHMGLAETVISDICTIFSSP